MDVEAVFIKEKQILSANHVVFVLQELIKLERLCKHEGSRKCVVAEAKLFHQFCDTAALVPADKRDLTSKSEKLQMIHMFDILSI